jgi:hypothetical protein
MTPIVNSCTLKISPDDTCVGPDLLAEGVDRPTVWVPLAMTAVVPEITVVRPEIEYAGFTETVWPPETTTALLPPGRIVVLPCNAGIVGIPEGTGILVEADRITFVVPPMTVALPPAIGSARLTGIFVGPRTTKEDPDATLTGPGRL